jgi:hypothetical protein
LPKGLKIWAIRTWRLRKLWKRRLQLIFSRSKSEVKYLLDDTLYWVDPEKIIFTMSSDGVFQNTLVSSNSENHAFSYYRFKGQIISGDWDSLTIKFTDIDFYKSYTERVLKGTRWEDLPYYKRVLGQIENGLFKWGCKTKQDLDRRCATLDKIFNDIKQNGYKSREIQRRELSKNSLLDADDEIAISIGRYGDLIFNNGRHRLTFAKIIGIPRVPVNITVRHSEWEEFKQDIYSYIRKNHGVLDEPLTHIDLQNIPFRHGLERFEMIRGNIGEGNSTVLDIGSNWGYYCHRFEEEGFQCTAVENDLENLYFLKKLRRAENRNFEIIEKPVLSLGNKSIIKYDIVLALAIFHHFLKEKTAFEEFRGLLRNLDVNEMYFEPHVYTEPQMSGSFINFTNEEFVNFILENSCLKNSKQIGKCVEKSIIYKLWR